MRDGIDEKNMNFNLIDIDAWCRREHYEHYMDQVPCSYSVVVNIDITVLYKILKEKNLKDYIAQIYILTCAVNSLVEFRMSLDTKGRLGYWDMMNPIYTVLHKEKETFSAIWTYYTASFNEFYATCMNDMGRFCTGDFSPKPGCPGNIFTISSVPWIDFTAFNINAFSKGTYLLPIFTIGKYTKSNGKIIMPLAIQVHHAVCDGLHVGKFIDSVKVLVNNCEQWLGSAPRNM